MAFVVWTKSPEGKEGLEAFANVDGAIAWPGERSHVAIGAACIIPIGERSGIRTGTLQFALRHNSPQPRRHNPAAAGRHLVPTVD